MKTILDKLQEIQRRAFTTTDNVACILLAHSTYGGHWSLAIHYLHDGNIVDTINIGKWDFNVEHRLDMILKHGLFGRLKA